MASKTIDFELGGIEKMRRVFATMAKNLPDEVAPALYQEAQIEAIKGRDISVTIVVGGPAASYAIYVHEDLDAWHDVGQAKFLESTINESKPFMARRVGKRIKLN